MSNEQLVVALRGRPIGSLGIDFWVNLTPHVKRVSVSRGKSSIFSDFPAGTVNVELNNNERIFDPTYTQPPFSLPGLFSWNAESIMGRRALVLVGFGKFDGQFGMYDPTLPSAEQFGYRLFTGYTNDWNLGYSPNGESIATVSFYDLGALLSEIFLEEDLPDEELSGERYSKVFAANRPPGLPSPVIDTGVAELGDQLITQGTSLLSYLNLIARTEGGYSFNNRNGRQSFVQRIKSSGSDYLQLGLDGIPIAGLTVGYGTELLYNRIKIENIGGLEVLVENTDSQDLNGVKELDITGLLGRDEDEALTLANYYLRNYSTPRLRFEEVEIAFSNFNEPAGLTENQRKLLSVEIGDFVEVSYRPNNIGDPVVQLRRVIGIRHAIRPGSHFISYALDDFTHNNFILDDELFGRLDVNQLL
jgi:hypothetical protein